MAERQPIAEIIADRFVGLGVNLLRLTAGEHRTILGMLAGLRDELTMKLGASDVDERSTFQQQRQKALMATVKVLIDSRYQDISDVHMERLVEIGATVSQRTLFTANAAIGVPLLTTGVSRATLKALADDALVLGRPTADWWSRQADNLVARFQQTIRQGIFSGETLGELTRRVRGRREHQFQDGIFAMSTREAEGLIRTSVQSVASAARYETLKANDDVLQGQQWLTALDGRVCEQCIPFSAQAWDFDGNPIGDTTQAFPGPPPLHWNDRCTLIPVVKSWQQLTRDAKGNTALAKKLDRVEHKLDPGTQASMDGQVAADLNYEDWLKTKPEAFQRDVLGDGKWKLWKAGKITLSDLVDQTGRPLTLEQLKAGVT